MKETCRRKLMVNINTGFAARCGSSGVIIRDLRGDFVAASMNFLPSVLDAHMAEAYALKEGLCLVQHIGCTNFIVQSDCLEVVETIKDGSFSASAAAPIFEECYDI
jgi:ribonuclease HI